MNSKRDIEKINKELKNPKSRLNARIKQGIQDYNLNKLIKAYKESKE
jgi:hypothetical protein